MPPVLAELASGEVYGGFVVFCRVAGALMLLPGFGEIHLPPRLRLAAAVVLTLAVAPGLTERPAEAPAGVGALAVQIGVESLAGLVIGLWARLLLLALHVAGAIAAQQWSLGAMMPGLGEPDGSPAVTNLMTMAGLALVFALDLHLAMIQALRDSYGLMPLGGLPDPAMLAEHVTRTIAEAFALGVRLAAPFLVIGCLVQLCLAVVNRIMPAFQVFFIAAPAVTLGGLVLLVLALPAMLLAWAESLGAAFGG
ncbi:flagellar biosynthetic protein FliR [Marinivivus vitaminiproducens]|uniref:flagellar biosynthetic protein FliR n=1 Tax=Marinivivus vitaminiproducens TaxID=3035935 RepID=UPI0027AB56FC|nr:flagellar biosynthetic protein FliR [Geminicoccaceae bacterium SCSIO 64248]